MRKAERVAVSYYILSIYSRGNSTVGCGLRGRTESYMTDAT